MAGVSQEYGRQEQQSNGLGLNAVCQLLKGFLVGAASTRDPWLASMIGEGVGVNGLVEHKANFLKYEGQSKSLRQYRQTATIVNTGAGAGAVDVVVMLLRNVQADLRSRANGEENRPRCLHHDCVMNWTP